MRQLSGWLRRLAPLLCLASMAWTQDNGVPMGGRRPPSSVFSRDGSPDAPPGTSVVNQSIVGSSPTRRPSSSKVGSSWKTGRADGDCLARPGLPRAIAHLRGGRWPGQFRHQPKPSRFEGANRMGSSHSTQPSGSSERDSPNSRRAT